MTPRSALAFGGLFCLSIFLVSLDSVPLGTSLAALALIWISAWPLLLYANGVSMGAIPFLPCIGLYYLVFFGLPVFMAPLAYHLGSKVLIYHVALDPIEPNTIALAAGGIAAQICTFFLATLLLGAKLPAFRIAGSETLSPRAMTLLYSALLAANLIYRYVPSVQAIPSVGQLMEPVGFLAFGGLYLQWRRGLLPRWLSLVALLVALPLDLMDRSQHLYLTKILFLAMFAVFIMWRERQFRIAATILIVGACLALTYSFTVASRYAGSTAVQSIETAYDYALRLIRGEGRFVTVPLIVKDQDVGEATYDLLISPLVTRIGQIWTFQAVHDLSPERVSYMDGATYRPLLTSFIPRIIYPDKPREQAGGEFGRHYGFMDDPAEQTSFNIPWIVELLANFGQRAVIVGMMLFGLLLAVLNRLFNARESGDLEFLIGLTIIFRLGYQESNFSEMTGSLLPLFVALYLYFRIGAGVLKRLRFA